MEKNQRQCAYCSSQEKTLTKEHIISKSVLREVFGPKIENVTLQPLSMGGRVLPDHEPQIRDVCGGCNRALSKYDEAGVVLVKAVHPHDDATGRILPFSPDILGWLLKTHLNQMRITPDETFKQPRGKPAIYRALQRHSIVSPAWYRLFVEGWQSHESWWEKDSPQSIQYFSYKGV